MQLRDLLFVPFYIIKFNGIHEMKIMINTCMARSGWKNLEYLIHVYMNIVRRSRCRKIFIGEDV